MVDQERVAIVSSCLGDLELNLNELLLLVLKDLKEKVAIVRILS